MGVATRNPTCEGSVMSRVLRVGLIVWLCGKSLSAREDATIPGYLRIDLSRGTQNHLLLPATIGGRPVSFILDTGIDLNFLQANRGPQLGLRPLGQNAQSNGQSFPMAQANNFKIGGASLGSETFALYQLGQLGGALPGVKGGRSDGIVGLGFLRRHRAVINCRTRHLFLPTNPGNRIDPGNILRAGFTRLAIEEDRSGYLTVACSIYGRPGRMRLDTGAFLTGVDDEAAHSLGLVGTGSGTKARGFEGKTLPVQVTQIDDLRIGSVRIAPQKFVILDVFGRRKPLRVFTGINRLEYYEPRRIAPGDTIFGLLGSELLDQRRAIIDLGSMSLYLR